MSENQSLALAVQVPEADQIVPKPPEAVPATELVTLKTEALALVDRIWAKPQDLSVANSITKVGEGEISSANRFFEARRIKVSDVMNAISDGKTNPLPEQIRRMRGIAEKFDPRPFLEQFRDAREHGGEGVMNLVARKLRGIPKVGELIVRVADHFKPFHAEISDLVLAMQGGVVALDENNAFIQAQAEDLQRHTAQVLSRAYFAELVFEELKKRYATASEDDKKRMIIPMSRVAKRALFLRASEQIYLQVLTGFQASFESNIELRDTVSTILSQAIPLLENLYMLIVIQQEALQIAEQCAQTQDLVVDLLKTGAELTKESTEEIGKLGTRMVDKMQDILNSKDTFIESLSIGSRLAEQTVEKANRAIPLFQKASGEIRQALAAHTTAELPPAAA
jgi:hypothetical protein